MLNDVSNGKGTIGKFFSDDTLYRKANDAVDKIDRLVDEINKGQGSLGKLVKDESLYNNANQTMAKANKLMDDLNSGRGAAGKLLKDEEFAHKLHNTIDKLSAIADRLEAGEGSAGKLLKDPSIYNNTDQLLVETRSLIKSIRENPKKYLTIHFRCVLTDGAPYRAIMHSCDKILMRANHMRFSRFLMAVLCWPA